MSHRSADLDRVKRVVLETAQIWVDPSNTLLRQMRDASSGRLAAGSQQGGDLARPVEAPQPNLAAGHEAKQEDQRCALGRQAALSLHPAPELSASLTH